MQKRGFAIGIGVAILVLICFYFDWQIIQLVSVLRNDILDKFFLWITFVSSEIVVFFGLTALLLWKENKRKWILPLWICLGASAIISFLLKLIVQRQRPFQLGITTLMQGLESSSYSAWNFSFPSFQTMLAFCAIPIISENFKKLKYFWIAFAFLIGFSRMYFGLHFLSDVLAGGFMGYLIGIGIIHLEKEKKFGERIYKKIFRGK